MKVQTSKPTFDQGYAGWKAWQSDGFGKSDPSTRAYFTSELRRAGLMPLAGKRFLEIGFGNGGFLEYLKSGGAEVVGIEAQAHLVRRGREMDFEVYEPSALVSLPEESFDAIVMFDVLEHIAHDEVGDLLAGLNAKLKPGGTLIARFPNGDSPLSLANQNGDPTHVNYIGSEKARFYFKEAGFELRFVGSPAKMLIDPVLTRGLAKLLLWLPRKLVEKTVRLLFFPAHDINYFSANLLVNAAKQRQAPLRQITQ